MEVEVIIGGRDASENWAFQSAGDKRWYCLHGRESHLVAVVEENTRQSGWRKRFRMSHKREFTQQNDPSMEHAVTGL